MSVVICVGGGHDQAPTESRQSNPASRRTASRRRFLGTVHDLREASEVWEGQDQPGRASTGRPCLRPRPTLRIEREERLEDRG